MKKNDADMFVYEKELTAKGCRFIAGVDEAGRGPLAGPVFAAACICDLANPVCGVNDSKALTPKKRGELYEKIVATAVSYKVISVSNEKIDEINILEATKFAMTEAIESLFPLPDHVLIDAVRLKIPFSFTALIHGDALSHSIAAASILAKVERDRIMLEYAEKYPEYGFESHKGYGSAHHIEMIKKYGPCPIHRRSFLKKILGEDA